MNVRQILIERIGLDGTRRVHVLDVADRDCEDQLQQRLKQAKHNDLVVIPYRMEDDHWTAVLIEFTGANDTARAE